MQPIPHNSTQPPPQTPPTRPAAAAPPHRPPVWANPRVLAMICTGLIVYGSLIPFDLAWPRPVPSGVSSWLEVFAAPRWMEASGPVSALGLSASASDLAINLLLYVPLGVLLCFSMPGRLRGRLLGGVFVAAGVLSVSWTLESLQSLSQARVSSLNDVVANTAAGGLAAILAPMLWARIRGVIFRLYCWTAPLRHRALGLAEAVRERPGVTYAFVAINAVLIGGWYLAQVRAYATPTADGGLPFERAFELPYDVAALTLGRSMLTYAGLGTVVLLAMASRRERVRLGWVVVVVTGLSIAAESFRSATGNARPDITGPILAAAAAILMALTLYCFSIAVRKSNRRHREQSYHGPERRQRAHDYLAR